MKSRHVHVHLLARNLTHCVTTTRLCRLVTSLSAPTQCSICRKSVMHSEHRQLRACEDVCGDAALPVHAAASKVPGRPRLRLAAVAMLGLFIGFISGVLLVTHVRSEVHALLSSHGHGSLDGSDSLPSGFAGSWLQRARAYARNHPESVFGQVHEHLHGTKPEAAEVEGRQPSV